MVRQTKTTPRKKPLQARAQATVATILDATARILVKDGYEGTSTNRVAEKAGVSVGSLYQYFPSKEALVAALIDAHHAEMRAVLIRELAASREAPLERAAHDLVRAMLAVHKVDPPLHRVLIEQVPRVGRLKKLRELDAELEELVFMVLSGRAADVRSANLRVCAFVLVHAVSAVCHGAVLDRPAMLDHPELANEMAHLILQYLRPHSLT